MVPGRPPALVYFSSVAALACASGGGPAVSGSRAESGGAPASAAGDGAGAPGGGAARGGRDGAAGATNGGATNGGATNGGATNGGATNGGATNGGATAAGRGGDGASAAGGTRSRGGASATGGDGSGGASGASAAGAGGGAGGTSAAGAGGGTDAAGAGGCVESSCGSHKWACWKMPNPATSPDSVPNHQSYTDLGNGAVRDDITCLVWEKANPRDQGTWQQSHDRCAALAASNYAGFDDWRMPTRVEMASISDVTRGSKGYAAIFGVTSGYYDTGSYWYETITGQSTSSFHWAYGTNGYTSNAVDMTNTDNVTRCVRGNGAGEAADELAVAPPNHYSVSGDPGSAEVTDNYTGLVWQQGFSPAIVAWQDAPAYCASLTLNGHTGFRVPTLNELASTVNEAKVGGAIDASAFPGNPNGCKEPKYWFWAAEASKVGGTAWGLSYCDGFTGWNAGASGDWNYFPQANVRCVR